MMPLKVRQKSRAKTWGGTVNWVAVQELKKSFYTKETLLFTIYTYPGYSKPSKTGDRGTDCYSTLRATVKEPAKEGLGCNETMAPFSGWLLRSLT